MREECSVVVQFLEARDTIQKFGFKLDDDDPLTVKRCQPNDKGVSVVTFTKSIRYMMGGKSSVKMISGLLFLRQYYTISLYMLQKKNL